MRFAALLRRPLAHLCQARRTKHHLTYCGVEGAFTSSGALRRAPLVTRFGLFRVIATVVPALGIGGAISMLGASYLEEFGIFAPEDDDD